MKPCQSPLVLLFLGDSVFAQDSEGCGTTDPILMCCCKASCQWCLTWSVRTWSHTQAKSQIICSVLVTPMAESTRVRETAAVHLSVKMQENGTSLELQAGEMAVDCQESTGSIPT